MSMAAAIVASVLILGGSVLALIAAVGLFRLPDVFGRMHAATKPAVLGVILVLFGCAVVLGDWSATARLLLAAILQLVTAPVAMNAVGRAVQQVIEDRYADKVADQPSQTGGTS
ncbi:monovalent cation/H(+) antiporter subunit G [soil metagenome]